MSELAVYDMDKTITRRPTYVPFLMHCAVRRAPWRLLLLPFVGLSLLAYALRLIDRARLKEINHHLLLGHRVHLNELKPLVESFADAQVETNIRPGAWVIANGGRAFAMAACGVTAQAQNTGISPGRIVTASP